MKVPLIVICGATATGKSSLALQLAQRLNSILISADSRQVYREFDIGTAKPSLVEQKLVPHYLIDICDPTETLTLAEYQAKAQALINSRLSSSSAFNSPPLLVGGTGLYIKSVVRGLKIPQVSPHPELRSQLEKLDQSHRYALLVNVDSAAAGKIHPHDSVRTIRALEVFYVTGKPISIQQGEQPPPYPILQIGLDGDVHALEERIKMRIEAMISAGLVTEVEALGSKYGWDLPLLETLGYGEIKQYLAGEITLEEAKLLTVLHTRQFAKRQRTWFQANPEIQWLNANDPTLLEQVWNLVKSI
jgi:tRNA dimethylallyltransferase